MSRKDGKIAALVEPFVGQSIDPHYLAYFDCFNRRLYFEAHEVLEIIWLPQRRRPDGDFYKGLIQLAGAFVHLQKARLGPAGALFRLAEANLRIYPPGHHGVNTSEVFAMIERCQKVLQSSNQTLNPLASAADAEVTLTVPTEDVTGESVASTVAKS